MPKGPFLPSEFVPTKFSTTQDKADFGNAFLHFIESEWVRTAFTKSFYNAFQCASRTLRIMWSS